MRPEFWISENHRNKTDKMKTCYFFCLLHAKIKKRFQLIGTYTDVANSRAPKLETIHYLKFSVSQIVNVMNMIQIHNLVWFILLHTYPLSLLKIIFFNNLFIRKIYVMCWYFLSRILLTYLLNTGRDVPFTRSQHS